MSDPVAPTSNLLKAAHYSSSGTTYLQGKAENVNTTLSQIGGRFDETQSDLADLLNQSMDDIAKDPSDPVALAKYQEASASITGLMNARSSMIKGFRDLFEQMLRNV